MSECGCDGSGWILMDPPEGCTEEYRAWWIKAKPSRMCECNPLYNVPNEDQVVWNNINDGGEHDK